MKVLGISAYYHDSAAALIADGEVIAAAQEERFTRKKHDSGFPRQAMDFCMNQGKLQVEDLDGIVFYDKPFLKFERIVETFLAYAPRGFNSFRKALPVWVKEKLFLRESLQREFGIEKGSEAGKKAASKILFSEHHLSHAASAFFPSPFSEAAILTMDGVGEWATTSLAMGRQNGLELTHEIHFPHSIGLLYSAFTYYLGFGVNSGEYKIMGLAPYGEPKYTKLIFDHLIDVKADGTFRLDLSYFDYCSGLKMTNQKFDRLFGGPARNPDDPLTQREMDLASSIQNVTELVVLRLCRSIRSQTGMKNLCLAGGVALNCVANGKIASEKIFENIWIQPAAGDAGGALGAAFAAYHLHFKMPRKVVKSDQMKGAFLGPTYSQEEIEVRLKKLGAHFLILDESELLNRCAQDLAAQKALGWFQGRMEFGPRALGGRSILGDARSPVMQSLLNLKIKYRESFRPFAPSVPQEDVHEWFDFQGESPYMLMVAQVQRGKCVDLSEDQKKLFGIEKLKVARSEIPSVTHVDYSARIQTVDPERNAKYHALLCKFKDLTGSPVLVNTSFNVRGEPIVESPEDAYRCFMGTELDALAIGNCYLVKSEQAPSNQFNYTSHFELD